MTGVSVMGEEVLTLVFITCLLVCFVGISIFLYLGAPAWAIVLASISILQLCVTGISTIYLMSVWRKIKP